jgi:HPt (histidine-containing phosphotransfer) domain-containing protein
VSRGNIALEHEVLRLFCAHLPVSLDRLRACRGRSFREAAHTIKGSAAAIGAWRLARAAERAERSDGGPPAARTAAITAVCAAAAEASRQIGRHMGRER